MVGLAIEVVSEEFYKRGFYKINAILIRICSAM